MTQEQQAFEGFMQWQECLDKSGYGGSMKPEQIADSVERLRALHPSYTVEIHTVNALVDLLIESHDGLNKFWYDEWYSGNEDCSDLIRKLATIKEKL